MNTEFDAVLDAAREVVNHSFKGDGYTVRKKLEDALDKYDASPCVQPVFLRPQEGDVCVLAFPDRISAKHRDELAAWWEKTIPGVKAVVVDACSGVQSFRPAKGGEDGSLPA